MKRKSSGVFIFSIKLILLWLVYLFLMVGLFSLCSCATMNNHPHYRYQITDNEDGKVYYTNSYSYDGKAIVFNDRYVWNYTIYDLER